MPASAVSPQLIFAFDSPSAADSTDAQSFAPTRGVAWVLRWAVAIATLVSSTAVLVEFGYCLAAEQALLRAARAGVLEATLPRATYQTVEQTVRGRLASHGLPPQNVKFQVEHNGMPARGSLVPRDSDQLSVTLVTPTWAVLPTWLRAITFRPADSRIAVRAERVVPGPRL